MRAAALSLRPFAFLATFAFLAGFLGYIALARPHEASAHHGYTPAPMSASGPSSDAWNFEKKI